MRNQRKDFFKTVVTLWLTLSFASVLLAALTWVQLSQELKTARDAIAVRQELDGILRRLLEVEVGQRGYTLTEDEQFLQPLRESELELKSHFEALTELTREDSVMLKRLMELRAQTELFVNHNRDIAQTRKANGQRAATAIIASGEGRVIMGEIRNKVAEIRLMRSGLVLEDGSKAQAQLLRASLISMIAGLLGIGAGLIALWLARLTVKHQQRERELVEARLRAEQSSREKTTFLANMSHEIRTPMNSILGFSELLENELREVKHRRYLKSIRTSAGSLLQLINDILDMSKIEAGVMQTSSEPTDPREICEFIHTVFSEHAARKGVKLECKIAKELPRALLMDRIRLRQILVNVVGNAVKFTDQGSIEVSVSWEKEDSLSHGTLIIEVQDTGLGIPQDKLELIFNPFVQAGAHRDKEKQGTGLGLSIVKRFVELMGGTVTVASIVGQGSVFHLRFQHIAVSSRLPGGDAKKRQPKADFNQLHAATLLVVDDNETNCDLVSGMFAGSHHRLVFAHDGETAVAKAREFRPDLVLMDLRMPGMDGREALAHIRRIPGMELLPIIAATASTLSGEEQELHEGFNGYLRKPFSQQELFEELTHFLTRTSAPKTDSDTTFWRNEQPILQPAAPELVRELQRLERDEWPAVRDGLAINQCKAFAEKLSALSRQWTCEPLSFYAQSLMQSAEHYEVMILETQLGEFSALVKRLAESAQPK